MKWAIPILASILILGGFGFTQQSFAAVPPGFFDFGGHCYGLTASDTWATTEIEAVSFGGHLATIDDLTENTFIETTLLAFAQFAWIGYNDIAVEGDFVWVSGIPGGFENWLPGNPDNAGGIEDAAALGGESVFPSSSGKWNDANPLTSLAGIIELDDTCAFAFAVVGGTIIPIDSTALLLAGVQSISMWMILGVLSVVGIGLAVFTLKRSR